MRNLRITAAVSLFLIFISSVPVSAQIEQRRRARARMNQSIRAEEEKERRRDEEFNGPALPKPKPAVMNVDVQGLLSTREFKNLAEAKLHPAGRVTDGENLWLYLKFKTTLGDYVLTTRDADDPTKLHYQLFAEIGPKGDVTALNQYLLQFNKEDLAANELKINLAPGLMGRNRSIPLFLTAAGAARPGTWANEIRISNKPAVPRDLNGHLASTPIVLDLKGGNAKFQKMSSDYDSIVIRGTTDISVLPVAGTFFDNAIKESIYAKLAAENIEPSRFYFAGDGWSEYLGSTMAMKRERKVYGVFTYRRAENCFYGLAEVLEKFDYSTGKFVVPGEITVTKDIAVPCAK